MRGSSNRNMLKAGGMSQTEARLREVIEAALSCYALCTL